MKIIPFIIVLMFTSKLLVAQNSNNNISEKKLLEFSDPANLKAPSGNAAGFPSRAKDLDVLPGFQNPPHGYGQVPFWWWTGDPLDKDRLLWQIEQLHEKGVNGMQVNYSHTKESGWPTDKAEPELFSKEWWEIWKFVADECGKRNMGIGLSGYTIDWPKPKQDATNLFSRIIYSIAEINGRTIELDTTLIVKAGDKVKLNISNESIGIWAYPLVKGKISKGGIDLQQFVKNAKLSWTPVEGNWEIYVFKTKTHPGTINPINPLSGKTVIDKFFQQFQNNTVNQTSEGLNYFFQDELKFGVGDRIWADDFNEAFKKQKGYNVFEILPALYTDMGQVTVKARLDFMDVKIHLAEERYFKPIFDWHWSRGMIYGCDASSRGKRPEEFGDYFRGVRWYTAPGHDTPGGNADLIKGKVSSSIASLYKRPRVWLEGYHSLGWGATPERLMFATSENYLYGCNLLNLHGLYYTTHGSFWEWAPPSYHFRMPYWDHLGVFLKYFERLSYLLSQGVLQTDVAVMYPVSPIQAEMLSPKNTDQFKNQSILKNKLGVFEVNSQRFTKTAFESGTELFNSGYDFTFMDHQSLARAEIGKAQFKVSDINFKVLVLPDMKSVRWSTVQQALKFYRNGGIVIAVASLPEASDRIGSDDPELDAAIKEIFGVSSAQVQAGANPVKHRNEAGGLGIFFRNATELKDQINSLLTKQVRTDKPVRAMYRKIGNRDVYMVMGKGENLSCHFLSKGKVEQWDPWTGKAIQLYETVETTEGTTVKLSFQPNQAQIVVFSPKETNTRIVNNDLDEITKIEDENGAVTVTGYSATGGIKHAKLNVNGQLQNVSGNSGSVPESIVLDGDWEFELKPTMDNRWGDFRLPVIEKVIGAEARIFRYSDEQPGITGCESPSFNDAEWQNITYGYGQKFWKLGPLSATTNFKKLERELATKKQIDSTSPVIIDGNKYNWKPYDYSWRIGIEGDPGDQRGYHGLKERVTNDFILLGEDARQNEGVYYLWTSAFTPEKTKATSHTGEMQPAKVYLNNKKIAPHSSELELRVGGNALLLRYDTPGRTHYVLEKAGEDNSGKRTPLSMKWWDMKGRINYDVKPASENPTGWYRFTAPPGLQTMTIRAMGAIEVWVNGEVQNIKTIKKEYPAKYKVVLSETIPAKSAVAVRIEHARGYTGGSALPEPILLECGVGINQTGNWSAGSVLECYSGGAWYRKNVTLSDEQAQSMVILDLGEEVVATAEVKVNGKSVGILVAAPWKLDISEFVNPGNNKIEVLVYNTLTNHFKTIPTQYNKKTNQPSGLLGPVKLDFLSKVVLK